MYKKKKVAALKHRQRRKKLKEKMKAPSFSSLLDPKFLIS